LIFSLLGCPVRPDNIIQHCHINIHFSPHWTQVSAQLVQDIFFFQLKIINDILAAKTEVTF
jgi:hypothetical protein